MNEDDSPEDYLFPSESKEVMNLLDELYQEEEKPE